MFPAAPPTRTLDFTVEHGTSQVSQRKALDLPNNATAPGREELLSISKVPLRFDRVVGGLKGKGPASRAAELRSRLQIACLIGITAAYCSDASRKSSSRIVVSPSCHHHYHQYHHHRLPTQPPPTTPLYYFRHRHFHVTTAETWPSSPSNAKSLVPASATVPHVSPPTRSANRSKYK